MQACNATDAVINVPLMSALGRQRPLRTLPSQRPLLSGDLNRWMQHLDSKYREEDVADEVQIEDLLQRRAEKLDVGSLAGGRFSA